MRKLNPTVIALLGGLVVLLLLVAYFATNRNSEQDKLTGNEVTQAQTASPEKRCASQATSMTSSSVSCLRRAAQLRGSDQAAYDKLSAYAVVRMENPVLEGEVKETGGVNCSARCRSICRRAWRSWAAGGR